MCIVIHHYWLCFVVHQLIETHYCPLPSKKKYLVENTPEVLEASERLNFIPTQRINSSDLIFGRIFAKKVQSSNDVKRNKIIGNNWSVVLFMRNFWNLFLFLNVSRRCFHSNQPIGSDWNEDNTVCQQRWYLYTCFAFDERINVYLFIEYVSQTEFSCTHLLYWLCKFYIIFKKNRFCSCVRIQRCQNYKLYIQNSN